MVKQLCAVYKDQRVYMQTGYFSIQVCSVAIKYNSTSEDWSGHRFLRPLYTHARTVLFIWEDDALAVKWSLAGNRFDDCSI
jgi:hypothetical protein